MESNERITLRLEKENLKLMDSFIKETKEFVNRSQLCRAAVQNFIESARKRSNEVSIKVPRYYLDFIDEMVKEGYFLSREHAIVRSLEEYFSRERVKEMLEHKKEMGKATGKIVSLDFGKKDEVISP